MNEITVTATSVICKFHLHYDPKSPFLKNLAKFTAKHSCRSLIFNKRLPHRCFPAIFKKFFRTTFLPNTSGKLISCDL